MQIKKKIAHLTYDMRIGGTETVIKNLVEGTNKTLFDIEILCLEPNMGPFGKQLIEKGYTITHLNWLGGFDQQVIKDIRRFIIAQKIDILHCHQYSPWVYGAIAAAFTKTKVVFTEHGRFYPDSSSWKRRIVNPFLVFATDYITTISNATKQALIDFEFIPPKKVDVIYNGINPLIAKQTHVEQIRTQLGIPKSSTILGTVARLDPIKNQAMMIKAFANIVKEVPDSYLIIVGDGEERYVLEKIVEQLKVAQNVIFTGYVAEPVSYIALMDIFLLSSLSEGTSMTLLEAMSLSKPCVVTDAGGNAEIIVDEYNGKVTPNDDKTEFSNAILNILLNDKKIKNMSQAALARFNELFNNKSMTSAYEAVYNGVTEHSSRI